MIFRATPSYSPVLCIVICFVICGTCHMDDRYKSKWEIENIYELLAFVLNYIYIFQIHLILFFFFKDKYLSIYSRDGVIVDHIGAKYVMVPQLCHVVMVSCDHGVMAVLCSVATCHGTVLCDTCCVIHCNSRVIWICVSIVMLVTDSDKMKYIFCSHRNSHTFPHDPAIQLLSAIIQSPKK